MASISHKDEFHDNVVAFCNPPLNLRPFKPVELDYVLRWFLGSADLPPIGPLRPRQESMIKTSHYLSPFLRRILGGPLAKLKPGEIPTAEVQSPTGAGIADVRVE